MKQLTMPSFGADMATGIIAQWKVQPGDEVKKGDIVASIDTMKGLIDMEVFDDGVIETLLAAEGEDIEVGQPIAELRLANEPNSATDVNKVTQTSPLSPKPIPSPKLKQEPNITAAAKVDYDGDAEQLPVDNKAAVRRRISPAARKKAAELAVDWQQLPSGSGPQGAILLEDITTMTNTSANALPSPERDSSQQMREAIAAVVSRSKREIPHYYLQLDMPLDNALAWLSDYNQGRTADERILLSALLYCAIARALPSFAQFNGFYVQGAYQAQESVHLGNAISLHGGGLMVAAIHNAQQLNPAQMMVKLKDQVIRAREGGLRMSELQDATITVSNLGDRGTDSMQSIIFPPQVAIIAIGRQRPVPWVVDEQVSIAHIVTVSLAADHRVSDGHAGARLLNKIEHLLQHPESLI